MIRAIGDRNLQNRCPSSQRLSEILCYNNKHINITYIAFTYAYTFLRCVCKLSLHLYLYLYSKCFDLACLIDNVYSKLFLPMYSALVTIMLCICHSIVLQYFTSCT